MPEPSGRVIPPEAGYPGLPIDDEPPSLSRAFTYQNEVARPRREFIPDIGEDGEWRKLEFGKPGGTLYPVWASTPWDLKQVGFHPLVFKIARLPIFPFHAYPRSPA